MLSNSGRPRGTSLQPCTATSGVASKRRSSTCRSWTSRSQPPSAARRVATAQLAHIPALSSQIDALKTELTPLVQALAPALLAIPGVGVLTAAKLLGETGDITRFRSLAAYARHNGTAPIPASSGTGTTGPHRLNQAGNRQLNTALHRIAITQARYHPPAQALLDRRQQTTRDTTKGSLRVLKRHLSDVIYHAMITDAGHAPSPTKITLT